MIDIPQPRILDGDAVQQMAQMKSYLFQLSQTLNWAFSTIETGGAGSAAGQPVVQAAGKEKSPVETFAGIKDLIIKSADIVNAYYTEISKKLEGVYVAQSEFGKYQQQTSQEIQENSTGITQLFENVQQLSGTLEELYNISLTTSAYIKTGLLYEQPDGTPVYGLEIGQTNETGGVKVFDKFARFSADRLSFFDSNDTEVAYISDYKLYITNAEITGSLRIINRFKIYYDNGLAFQWIGGES